MRGLKLSSKHVKWDIKSLSLSFHLGETHHEVFHYSRVIIFQETDYLITQFLLYLRSRHEDEKKISSCFTELVGWLRKKLVITTSRHFKMVTIFTISATSSRYVFLSVISTNNRDMNGRLLQAWSSGVVWEVVKIAQTLAIRGT